MTQYKLVPVEPTDEMLAELTAEAEFHRRQEEFKRMMENLSKTLQRQMRECRGEK